MPVGPSRLSQATPSVKPRRSGRSDAMLAGIDEALGDEAGAPRRLESAEPVLSRAFGPEESPRLTTALSRLTMGFGPDLDPPRTRRQWRTGEGGGGRYVHNVRVVADTGRQDVYPSTRSLMDQHRRKNTEPPKKSWITKPGRERDWSPFGYSSRFATRDPERTGSTGEVRGVRGPVGPMRRRPR